GKQGDQLARLCGHGAGLAGGAAGGRAAGHGAGGLAGGRRRCRSSQLKEADLLGLCCGRCGCAASALRRLQPSGKRGGQLREAVRSRASHTSPCRSPLPPSRASGGGRCDLGSRRINGQVARASDPLRRGAGAEASVTRPSPASEGETSPHYLRGAAGREGLPAGQRQASSTDTRCSIELLLLCCPGGCGPMDAHCLGCVPSVTDDRQPWIAVGRW
ncbi:unnamed protein product, partial [Effrenium voratum]